MKKYMVLCLLLAVFSIAAFSMVTSAQDSRGGAGSPGSAVISWLGYADGMARGKAQDKKVFLYFVADWCVYCKKMDAETFANQTVASYLEQNFVPIKVDFDRKKDLVSKYGVRGLPTTVFITEKGESISSLPGFIPPDQMLPILKFIETDSYLRMSFQHFMENGGT